MIYRQVKLVINTVIKDIISKIKLKILRVNRNTQIMISRYSQLNENIYDILA